MDACGVYLLRIRHAPPASLEATIEANEVLSALLLWGPSHPSPKSGAREGALDNIEGGLLERKTDPGHDWSLQAPPIVPRDFL